MSHHPPHVQTGLDRLVGEGFRSLRGARLGAIVNPTSVDCRLRHLADLLHATPNVELVALFGPEHGVGADAQDMIAVGSSRDARTGAVVHSLYGSDEESLSPRPEQLEDLDALVFDIQDVGSRYYTFAATMLLAMKAAARAGLRFVVLDRPNPIGGAAIEGPGIEQGYHSFCGIHSLPNRHGMTVGELAKLFRAELELDLEMEIIPCTGWKRTMLWHETGLPWVLPSPNMPTPDTALVYPGGCLVEGTNLSEGRGTTRPFELWGAPWIDPYALADSLGETHGWLPRPSSFRPMFHKHAGELCQGVQPHVVDPAQWQPLRAYTRMLAAARAQDPVRFAWRTEPYEFISEPIAIDLLFGSPAGREAIEAGTEEALETLFATWTGHEAEFRERRRPYLLYDEPDPWRLP